MLWTCTSTLPKPGARPRWPSPEAAAKRPRPDSRAGFAQRVTLRTPLPSPTRHRQPQKLGSRPRGLREVTPQRARYGARVLLLHPAHHHAEVPGFDDHPDTLRSQDPAEGVRDLIGEPLLHL